MTPDDELLSRALRRPAPPDDLVSRVMGQVHAAQRPSAPLPRRRPIATRIVTLAAAAALLLAAGASWQQQRQALRAERAAADLRTALQITTDTLTMAVHRMNRPSALQLQEREP